MMPLSLSEESFDILFHFLFLLSSIPCQCLPVHLAELLSGAVGVPAILYQNYNLMLNTSPVFRFPLFKLHLNASDQLRPVQAKAI